MNGEKDALKVSWVFGRKKSHLREFPNSILITTATATKYFNLAIYIHMVI